MSSPARSGPRVVRFPLVDLVEQVDAFLQRWPAACADRRGYGFSGDGGARLRVPLLAPRVGAGEMLRQWRQRLPGQPERTLVVLLQAGAMAMGAWDGDECIDHRAIRRYVVRGHGKAQPLHHRTKGKSRYGARLRLQNWRRLLVETNERLHRHCLEHGEPERVFVAMPVRVANDLWSSEPPPPFARDDARVQRVPMHVHRPDFAELQRVRHWLAHGRLELPD